MRVVVTQGPLHAVVAGAVASHLQQERPDENVLVIGDLMVAGGGALATAIRTCAAAGPWSRIVEVPAGADPIEGLAGVDPAAVTEVMAIRNWQPLNVRILEAFPRARATIYGDTMGILDTDPAGPRVDRIVTPLPQPRTKQVVRDTPVEVVPRASVVDAVRAAREGVPGLVEYDAEIAEWARGGVLVLLANLADAGESSLRGEIVQGHVLVRRLAAAGAPVVIKPHPRAALGQAAALARRLRAEGHPVRVVTAEPYGVYPVELFESLVRSVAGIQSGLSSSVASLLYLYGVESHVDMPMSLVLRTEFPYLWRLTASVIQQNRQVQSALAEWDGRSPLPVSRPLAAGLPERVVGGLIGRVFAWNLPTPPAEARVAAPAPDAAVRDHALGIAWDAPADAVAGLLDDLPVDPRDRVARTLERLRSRAAGAETRVAVHVRAPVNAPRWERLLTRDAPYAVAENARFTPEEFEELLEEHVDVTERRPELVDRSLRRALTRGRRPLRVDFRGRLRDGDGSF